MPDMTPHKFLTSAAAREFILSGAAVFTIVSEKTGDRYTFKVQHDGDGRPLWYVKMLIGPNVFTYLGMIANNEFKMTRASKNKIYSKPFMAFQYMWQRLDAAIMPQHMEIWHEGRCGRCGKRLTDPTSIERGFGPECQEILDRTHLQMP